MTSPGGVRAFFATRYDRWLKQRLPRARSITLEQRRLFIFPTKAGFLFLFTLLLMLLTAINYQNNMSYGLTFWLGMLFIVAIHFTHGNLMSLNLHAVSAESVFPGQQAEFVLRLQCTSKRRGHHAVKLVWPDAEVMVDVQAQGAATVSLFQTVGSRGWFRPPRLKVESSYPLGLLRCWSYVDLDFRALVWPKPLPAGDPLAPAEATGAQGAGRSAGSDDLTGFRDYREGDSPRHVDWRGYAREQSLQTRLYSSPVREDHWLDWDDFPEGTVEQRLSWLCWWVLEYDTRGDDYGLRLPGVEIPLASGDRQREQALYALATFGLPDTADTPGERIG